MTVIMSINCNSLEKNGYIRYLIKEFDKQSNRMIFCLNKSVDDELLSFVHDYSEDIYIFEDYIDINRWKQVLLYLKSDSSFISDDVVLVNDSMFGPLFELSELFMSEKIKQADFWGITAHGSFIYQKDNSVSIEIPRFIQSYLIGINNSLLCKEDFWNYVYRLPLFQNYDEAMKEFEFKFTSYFENLGYNWVTYIDTLEKETNDRRYFESFILFDTYDLIARLRMPFLAKYAFSIDSGTTQQYNLQGDLRKSLEYIKDFTNYDVGYIYENIIPQYNIASLINRLDAYYVLNDNSDKDDYNDLGNNRVAIFSYLFYEDLFEYDVSKLKNIPSFVDIYISSDTNEKLIKLKKMMSSMSNRIFLVLHNGKGRDISALLISFKKYIKEYSIIGFIHDKKSSQMAYSTVGASFNDVLWENMLCSTGYILEVLELLISNKYLGMLAPQMPILNTYYHTCINSWTICYEKTAQLLADLNVSVPLSENVNPVFLGSVFWAKTDALLDLIDYDFEFSDFPDEPMPVDGTISHSIERAFPYCAQNRGYYVGYITSSYYAGVYQNIYREDLFSILSLLKQVDEIDTSTHNTTIQSLESFVKNYCDD